MASTRELAALRPQQLPKSAILAPRSLRSATRSRELAGPPSSAATIVLQCNDLRMLIQSFTVYESNPWFDDEGVDGGWKLAHLCKLNFTPRLALIGDLRKWTVDDMERYYKKRILYIKTYKHAAPSASFKERQKLTCDVPQLVVQMKKWLKYHRDTIKLANDEPFLQHLHGLLKSCIELYEIIKVHKETAIATQYQRYSIDELWRLRNTVQTNMLKLQCNASRIKYEELLKQSTDWLRGLLEGDYSNSAKGVLRAFVDRLDTMDPLDGHTIEHVRPRAGTVCYRGAMWKYNEKRQKICQYRAGAELIISAHGQPNLIVQDLIVNGERWPVELPEDAFADEEVLEGEDGEFFDSSSDDDMSDNE